MTSLTLATVALLAWGFARRTGFAVPLALAGATPVGAAFIFGGFAVPTFYALAAGAAIAAAEHAARRCTTRSKRLGSKDQRTAHRPIFYALMLFLVVAVVGVLVAPILFDGIAVQVPGQGLQELHAGSVTRSNIAQLTYLGLGIAVVFYLSRSSAPTQNVVGLAAMAATLLSFWAWLHQASSFPYPVGLFDNSPSFTFQETLPTGEPRVRGIFSEPAGLATSSLVTIAYIAARWRQCSPRSKVFFALVAGVAAFLGTISTSTTFIVAGAILIAAMGLAVAYRVATSRLAITRSVVAGLVAAAFLGVWLLPAAVFFLGSVVDDKVLSSSYVDRSSLDAYSYDLVADTLGFGVGLGSNRASSFAASLLSTVGILGVALFCSAIAIALWRSRLCVNAQPAAWALVALLICKLISGPDLSDTTGILWLALGTLAGHTASRDQLARRPYSRHGPTTDRPTRSSTSSLSRDPQQEQVTWLKK